MTFVMRRIAGHTFTLTPGRRYLAGRPMAAPGTTRFDVTILDTTDGVDPSSSTPAAVVAGLEYDAANELINAFNDPDGSFAGRIW